MSEQEEKFKANWIEGFVRSSLCNEVKEGVLSKIVKNFGTILQEKIQDEKYRFDDDYAYGISKMRGKLMITTYSTVLETTQINKKE